MFQSTLPTRGSDPSSVSLSDASGRFQSTLPTMGSDLRAAISHRMDSAFQSTLPTRGSDQLRLDLAIPWSYFNPRSP